MPLPPLERLVQAYRDYPDSDPDEYDAQFSTMIAQLRQYYGMREYGPVDDPRDVLREALRERGAWACPKCHRISYNQNDAQHRYCGACHG